MAKIAKYIRSKMFTLRGFLARRVDPFFFLRRILPPTFFRNIYYLHILKKIPLFLLISLVIASFIITSMPQLFLV